MERFLERFETVVIGVVQLFVVVTIVLTVGALAWLLIFEAPGRLSTVDSIPELHLLVIRALGGALLVLLGLEVLESLKTFELKRHVRLELILIIATIAVGRHIILLDFEHVDGLLLVGVAGLVVALTTGYFIVRRSQREHASVADPHP